MNEEFMYNIDSGTILIQALFNILHVNRSLIEFEKRPIILLFLLRIE